MSFSPFTGLPFFLGPFACPGSEVGPWGSSVLGACVHGGRRCGESTMAGTAMGKGTSRHPSGDSGDRSLARRDRLTRCCVVSVLSPSFLVTGEGDSLLALPARACDFVTGGGAVWHLPPGRIALELNSYAYGLTVL